MIPGLNYVVFGNGVYKYVLSLIILLSFFLVSRVTKYILRRYLFLLAEKTRFKLDDILFRSLNPPLNMFVFAGLFYYSYHLLVLPDTVKSACDKIFSFLIIIPIVYFLIKFSTEAIGFYLKENEKRKVNEAAVDLLMQISRIALVIIGVILILDNLGYNVSALLTGLGVGGLAFALAAQDVLKNFFAGIAIIFDGTFKKGDRIKFNDTVGFVYELRLRTTKIRTLDGTIITVPNSMLSDNMIENIQRAPKFKVSMVVGVTYNTSLEKLRKVKEVIENILKSDEDITEYWVWFDEFGAYSLNISIIYYMRYNYSDWPERALVKERINFKIKEELERIGVEMAFPTQTIELVKKK